MVNKPKQLAAKNEVEKGAKKANLFQTLLMWTLIPLLFTTMVLLIIAFVADINVLDEMKKMSSSLPFSTEKKSVEDEELAADIEERVVSLQAEIKEKESQVYKLQEELEQFKDEKNAWLTEQENLQRQIEALQRAKEDNKRDVKEIISTFEKMSAKSAAPVISNMNDAEAIQILTALKPEVLAPILEKMSAEDAAKYTSLMTK